MEELPPKSVDCARYHRRRGGDDLLRDGESHGDGAAFHAYLMLEGRVVVKREERGRLRTIRTVGPGEQIRRELRLARTPRTATAIAEEPTRVLRLPADSLRELMRNPRINRVIRSRMAERL